MTSIEAPSASYWQPLSKPTCTRVARLHPGRHDDPIVISLEEVDLVKDPQYQALSYTWGTQLATSEIKVNGEKLTIKKNLRDILRLLRDEEADLFLWIDAICIDQNNLKEKASHVQLIGKIFEQAIRVRAWLGFHQNIIEELVREWEKLKPGSRPRVALSLRPHAALETSTDYWERIEPSQFARHVSMLEKLLAGPYWSRTWIIQELVFAQDIILQCNKQKLPWELFCEMLDYVNRNSAEAALAFSTKDLEHTWAHVELLRQLNQRHRDQMLNMDVISLLNTFAWTQQKMPHDRIFAFLSMDRPCYGELEIEANYEWSLAELYIQVFTRRLCRDVSGLRSNTLCDDLNHLFGGSHWTVERSSKTSLTPSLVMEERTATAYCLLRDLGINAPEMIQILDGLQQLARADVPWGKFKAALRDTAHAVDLIVCCQQAGGRWHLDYGAIRELLDGILERNRTKEKEDELSRNGIRLQNAGKHDRQPWDSDSQDFGANEVDAMRGDRHVYQKTPFNPINDHSGHFSEPPQIPFPHVVATTNSRNPISQLNYTRNRILWNLKQSGMRPLWNLGIDSIYQEAPDILHQDLNGRSPQTRHRLPPRQPQPTQLRRTHTQDQPTQLRRDQPDQGQPHRAQPQQDRARSQSISGLAVHPTTNTGSSLSPPLQRLRASSISHPPVRVSPVNVNFRGLH